MVRVRPPPCESLCIRVEVSSADPYQKIVAHRSVGRLIRLMLDGDVVSSALLRDRKRLAHVCRAGPRAAIRAAPASNTAKLARQIAEPSGTIARAALRVGGAALSCR